MIKEMICAYLGEKGLKYQAADGADLIKTGFSGRNAKKIDIYIHIDEAAGEIHLRSFDYIDVPDDKLNTMLKVCSDMNQKYNWVKFFVDNSDNTVTLTDDAIIDPSTCGEETFGLLLRMMGVCDDAYPTFMRALYS